MILWLIGMSGAGKTTLGKEIYQIWKKKDPATVFLDGDEVRKIFRQNQEISAYSLEGRRENARRIHEICRWLDSQGINVVCCILAIFDDILAENRRAYSSYFEIYIQVPFTILQRRDNKNLYAPALAGTTQNVVGVDIPFPEPKNPDIVIDNSISTINHLKTATKILEIVGVTTA